jgi:hypothetical protein
MMQRIIDAAELVDMAWVRESIEKETEPCESIPHSPKPPLA